jgi:hypothetical protein
MDIESCFFGVATLGYLPQENTVLFESGFRMGFGFGSVFDPYSIRSVDPDLYSESGSGSRRAKMTHKSRKK